MDPTDKKLLDDVSKHGWHVIKVPADEVGPGFAYTVGLFSNYGHPEVIIFGLSLESMHAILNVVGDQVKSGNRFCSGDLSAEIINAYSCTFVDFPTGEFREYLGYALWFYSGPSFPALQLVWPDKGQRFPWEVDVVQQVRQLQPVPGRPDAQ